MNEKWLINSRYLNRFASWLFDGNDSFQKNKHLFIDTTLSIDFTSYIQYQWNKKIKWQRCGCYSLSIIVMNRIVNILIIKNINGFQKKKK